MLKRGLCALIACVLVLGLCTCGAAAETVGNVQAAMNAANRLCRRHLLATDGSIITIRDTSYQQVAAGYVQLDGLKKLCGPMGELNTYALTESGELYDGAEKIASGVEDLVFSTTSNAPEGFLITADGIRRIYDNVISGIDYTSEFVRPEGGDQVAVSAPIYIGVDNHTFLALDESGRVFVNKSATNRYDDLVGMGVFDWENLAMVAIALYGTETMTVAGIQKDGTVVAAGDYAEEILDWGLLSYLAMSDGTIIGLTADGSLKLTGQDAEMIRSSVESRTGIAAVEVCWSKIGALVTAVDTNGDFRFICVNHNAVEGEGRVTLEDGSESETCFRYAPDGTLTRSCDNGGWTPVD